jgi:hypothetical protein
MELGSPSNTLQRAVDLSTATKPKAVKKTTGLRLATGPRKAQPAGTRR